MEGGQIPLQRSSPRILQPKLTEAKENGFTLKKKEQEADDIPR